MVLPHRVQTGPESLSEGRGWLRGRSIALQLGCLSSLLVSSQDGSCFGHHRVAAVDDEEQDRRVVERARCCRVWRDLGCSPGSEYQDGHEPQEAVPAVGRSADADGGNGGRDNEQRDG
jgi:hypothetical protein